jgi:hypothetical protein
MSAFCKKNLSASDMDPVTDKYEINYSIKLSFLKAISIKQVLLGFPAPNPLFIQSFPESLIFRKSSHLHHLCSQ